VYEALRRERRGFIRGTHIKRVRMRRRKKVTPDNYKISLEKIKQNTASSQQQPA
jgi:hypothetical protein